MPEELSKRITDAPDAVKRAVKEALDDKRMEDLSTQLTSLATQMTAGFTAMTTRQDHTNGKVLKNDARITILETKQQESGFSDKWTWLVITTLVSIVVYYLTKTHGI